MLLTLITFLIVLSVLVFVHEFGHFWTARRFGVKAEEFGFGFPPRVWGIYKTADNKWKTVRGSKEVDDAVDTVYSINAIPMGGFVKIKGENGDAAGEDSFVSKPIWQRVVILSAGVFMNIVLAAVVIIISFMLGMPQSIEGVSDKANVSDRKIQIMQVLPNTPADRAGLKAGDAIDSIDGHNFAAFSELQTYVDENTGKELNYVIKRGDELMDLIVIPEKMKETGKGGIGVALNETGIVKYPWYLAIWEGLKTTVLMTWAVIVAFFELFKNLFTGHGAGADVAGPVKIASMTGEVARLGFIYLLQFMAMLSINLAVINFLPIPALDGGRVLFLIIEKIKGKPMRQEVEAVLHNVFFMLLMALVLFITIREVAGLEVIKAIWHKII